MISLRSLLALVCYILMLSPLLGQAETPPLYPDQCRQNGGSNVCRPAAIAPTRYSYFAYDLGPIPPPAEHPIEGFGSLQEAQEHYARSYFGEDVCAVAWKTVENWAELSLYESSTLLNAKVSAGSECIDYIAHDVRITAIRPGICPTRFELGTASDGRYYCAGQDWVDNKNLGMPDDCAGNPCNVATGNKFQEETDFVVPAVGGLRFSRYYNSRVRVGSDYFNEHESFVGGWTHTYSRSIEYKEFEPGIYSAKAQRPDGRVLHYYRIRNHPTAGYNVAERLEPIMSADQIVGWKFYGDDDSVELYDGSGRLTSITDRHGWTQVVTYDASGLTVTDAFGRKVTLTQGPQSLTVTDPAGNAFVYRYSGNFRIDSVTYPDGTTRTYLYDEPSLNSSAKLVNALTGIIDENGVRYATWTYDLTGRVVSSEHAGGAEKVQLEYVLDQSENPLFTIVKDALGGSRTYSYNDGVRNGRVLSAGWVGTCPDCSHNISFKDYNGYDDLRQTYDQNGNSTTYRFDEWRHLEIYRNESGRVTETQWHPQFRLPTLVTEAKRITKYTYNDANGLLIEKRVTDRSNQKTRIWTYTYDDRLLKTVDGPRTDVADITKYEYDGKGNLAAITDALGKVTKFTSYDLNGRLLQMSDPNGLVTKFVYNSRGLLIQRTRGTETINYEYENTGLLSLIGFPTGATLKYKYDDAHRLTDIEAIDGERVHFSLNVLGQHEREEIFNSAGIRVQSKSATFNLAGKLLEAIDAYNLRTTYSYDANGNLQSVEDPLQRVVSLHNDQFNRVDEVTLGDGQSRIFTEFDEDDEIAAVVSPSGQRVEYTLDGLGNRKETYTPDWDAATLRNSYDAAGNMTTNVDFRGVTTTYVYDAINRLKKVSAPGATPITLTYDSGNNGIGHLTSAVDESGTTSLTYGLSGRLTQSTRAIGTLSISVAYKYDDAGRLIEVTYPSGRLLKYEYSRDKVIGLSFQGTRILSGIEYHPFGTAAKWYWGNGKPYERSFNLNGEIESFDYVNSKKTIRRDDARRIIAIEDAVSPELNQGFVYDDLDRLTEYHTGSPLVLERKFAYDVDGNRRSVEVSGAQHLYTYLEGSNVLLLAPGSVTRNWAPADAQGTSITDGNNIFKIDPYRRINGVANEAVSVSYLRDYSGRRVTKKSVNGVDVHYVFDMGGNLIAELDNSGRTLVEYLWLDEMPIAVYQQGSVNYIFTDHLNTPRAVTDAANVLRWAWHSEPFGSTPANDNPLGNGKFSFNLRFPGQYFDVESALHYNYFRDYDPQTGRYVQSDPIGLAGGINTYGYVGGNPISNSDSAGLATDVRVCYFGVFCGPPIRPPGTIEPTTNQPWTSVPDDGDGRGRGRESRNRESSTPQNCPPSKEDCEKQWTEARLVCRSLIYEQMQQRAGRRKKRSVTGVTGGYTDVEECARGLVSEECGGNKKR